MTDGLSSKRADIARSAIAEIERLRLLATPYERIVAEQRNPTRAEAREAAKVLLICNGHDLSVWTDDTWPDQYAQEGLEAIAKE